MPLLYHVLMSVKPAEMVSVAIIRLYLTELDEL
jgi:hypothetical protein